MTPDDVHAEFEVDGLRGMVKQLPSSLLRINISQNKRNQKTHQNKDSAITTRNWYRHYLKICLFSHDFLH